MVDKQEAFDKVQVLRALPELDRERLARAATVVSLARGEPLWVEGRPSAEFCFVLRGRLKLVAATEGGRDAILEMVGPGEIVCGSAPCAFAPYCCGAVALEPGTEVMSVPRAELLRVMERDGAVGQALLHEMSCRGMAMCKRVEEVSTGQVPQRIAKLLLRLADRAGVPRAGEGTWVPIRLSRQDLADVTGTTIETAIRVMTRWAKQGLVVTAARGFVVRDRARLDDVARGRERPKRTEHE